MSSGKKAYYAMTLVRNKTLKRVSTLLKRYRIVKDNTGKRFTFSHEYKSVQKASLKIKGKTYHLVLKEIKLKEDCYEDYENSFFYDGQGDAKARIFELKLIHNKKSKILQRDKRLPKSRGCVYRYHLDSAYVYK